jgi:hypothetical protein
MSVQGKIRIVSALATKYIYKRRKKGDIGLIYFREFVFLQQDSRY